MEEERQPESGSRAGRWPLWVGVALLVYVLSLGPVTVWEANEGWKSPGLLQVCGYLYAPLHWLMRWRWCYEFYEHYSAWCAEMRGYHTHPMPPWEELERLREELHATESTPFGGGR